VYLRFGGVYGMYISISGTSADRMISGLDIETGDPTLLGRLSADADVVIGRTSDCKIKVMHAIVSRQHLSLHLSGNVLLVRDLGSTNGTYFYGKTKNFDVADYIQHHPLDKTGGNTLDWLHETFGPQIAD